MLVSVAKNESSRPLRTGKVSLILASAEPVPAEPLVDLAELNGEVGGSEILVVHPFTEVDAWNSSSNVYNATAFRSNSATSLAKYNRQTSHSGRIASPEVIERNHRIRVKGETFNCIK